MRSPSRSTDLTAGRLCALPLALILLLGLALTSCDTLTEADLTGTPAGSEAARSGDAPGTAWAGPDTPPLAEVAVMSQNLYLGGDLFQLLDPACTASAANPLAFPMCVDRLYDAIVASDFATRAESVADEIARVRPALVGLQEVSTYYVQAPGDNLPNAPATPATDVTIDFLSLLLDALADRGLDYTAVSVSQNADVELPAFDAGAFYDVRYQDADVVLALDAPDVATGATTESEFSALLQITIGGTLQTFVRGYQTVEAVVDGLAFTFVNTHLEVGGGEAARIQEAQAQELKAVLDPVAGPLVLVGDLNSDADGSGTQSYPLLTTTLTDVFERPNLQAQPTCCQAADLLNATSLLDRRIDFVLYRGFDQARKAETVLDEPEDRVESAGRLLWPSDHAGVVALLVYNLRRARPHT